MNTALVACALGIVASATPIRTGPMPAAAIPAASQFELAISPLMAAVRRQDEAGVRQLLQKGADPNEISVTLTKPSDSRQTDKYESPLLVAVRQGNEAIAGLLLDAGARVRWRDGRGRTTAELAAALNRSESLRARLSESAQREFTLAPGWSLPELVALMALENIAGTYGSPEARAQMDSHRLQRIATTRLERLYYGCESLVTLSVIAMIGAWRARAIQAITPTPEVTPAARVPAANARRRFRIALSFPGDVRDRAERIADVLARTLGKHAVFYDRWYRAELARPNLDLYLQNIYKVESDLLVILLCAEYEQKEWCGLEWRVVRDLIKGRESERIMFLRLDEAPIEGLLSIDGYLDVVMLGDEEVAEAVLTRVRGATTPDSNRAS